MRDSVVFYRSFMNATDDLPPEQYKRFVASTLHYAMDDKEPGLSGIDKALFDLIKPQIDANNKKFTNGKLGGAPIGNQNARKQPKNNQKQPKNNQKQPNVNVNVNVNENVNEKENVEEPPPQLPTYKSLCNKYGKAFVDERMERSKRYKSANILTVARWCQEDYQTGFNGFTQRKYDFEELEEKLLKK